MEHMKTPITVISICQISVFKEQDVVPFRRKVKEQAEKTGMGIVNQTKLITAASEISRNMLKYANGGIVVIETVAKERNTGIRLTFRDQGPGIADIALAMKDGYSTGDSLGLGLPGARRLVNEFEVQSNIAYGTIIKMIKWKNG
jgi:serine/threonine-protein kinase RsbT